jgi:hypothetical protein
MATSKPLARLPADAGAGAEARPAAGPADAVAPFAAACVVRVLRGAAGAGGTGDFDPVDRELGGCGGTGAADGAAAGPAAPLAGSVGSLIVAVGLGGKLIRTVSFLGCTFAASPGLGGTAPPGKLGVGSDISYFGRRNVG